MSPEAIKHLYLAFLLLHFVSSALRIRECIYDHFVTDKDVGYPACLVKDDFAQEDLASDKPFKTMMKILIFPHRASKILLTPNPVHYECGSCKGCQQHLIECATHPNFVELQICSSLYLEATSDLCFVNSDSTSQFMVDSNSSTVGTFIDPHTGENDANGISREKRYVKACSFPNALETAQINCRLYPKKVKCIQRCAFGYTMDIGIKQEMECNYKENVWKPIGFRECRPFVDCTLTLTKPGNANCTSMSLKNQPSCRVTCLEYEDNEALPETVHSCGIDGRWDPPLPFCAIPGTGLVLTKMPAIKLHDDEEISL